MPIELYGLGHSPWARKVMIVLFEKNIPYNLIPSQNDSHGQYGIIMQKQVNPLNKTPVLITESKIPLFDSAVITEYLESQWPEPALMPKDPLARAITRRWEALADGLADTVVAPRSNIKTASALMVKINDSLDAIAQGIGAKDHCVNDTYSLADIAVGCVLIWLDVRNPEYDWRKLYPNLDKFTHELAKTPSFQATNPY